MYGRLGIITNKTPCNAAGASFGVKDLNNATAITNRRIILFEEADFLTVQTKLETEAGRL